MAGFDVKTCRIPNFQKSNLVKPENLKEFLNKNKLYLRKYKNNGKLNLFLIKPVHKNP